MRGRKEKKIADTPEMVKVPLCARGEHEIRPEKGRGQDSGIPRDLFRIKKIYGRGASLYATIRSGDGP